MERLASTNQHLWAVKTLPGRWGDSFPLLVGLLAAITVGFLIHMNEQIFTTAKDRVLLSFISREQVVADSDTLGTLCTVCLQIYM